MSHPRKPHQFYYDPIQRVIDWQLRSRWPKGVGGGDISYVSIKEEIEDRLCDAIDLKHGRILHIGKYAVKIKPKDEDIVELYGEGYVYREIATITGVHGRKIQRKIKNIKNSVQIQCESVRNKVGGRC